MYRHLSKLKLLSSTAGASIARSCHLTVKKTVLGEHTVAQVSLRSPPVNSLNLALGQELCETLETLNQDGDTDGIVISSSYQLFSAGLDLFAMYQPTKESLGAYWRQVQEVWLKTYSSRLPIVVAINGHCFGGGLVIALACDYRIAAKGNYLLGVSAAKFGVVATPWYLKMTAQVIGHRMAELTLEQGQVFTPYRAKEVGLIDEVCEPNDLGQQCNNALLPFMNVSPDGRFANKIQLRQDLIELFHTTREKDIEAFVDYTMQDSVQESLGKYVEDLKKK